MRKSRICRSERAAALAIRSYFPLDGEYEFNVELAGGAREPHQLEITVDGERKATRDSSARRAAADAERVDAADAAAARRIFASRSRPVPA